MRDRIAQYFVPLVVLVVGVAQLRGALPLAARSPADRTVSTASASATGAATASDADLQAVRRTMASMRVVARALNVYEVDAGALPAAEEWTDVASLEDDLVPLYLSKLPRSDSWGWSLQYLRKDEATSFALRSRGSDGVIDPPLDAPLSPLEGGDIVFQDRGFRKDAAPLERVLDDADRQRLALEGLRNAGTACEEYAIDNNFYPVIEQGSDLAALSEILVPSYILRLPVDDPWGYPFRYQSTPGGTSYRIESLGKDGRAGPENLDPESPDPDRDLAFVQGQFLLEMRALEAIERHLSSDESRCAATIEAMTRLAYACGDYAEEHEALPAFSGWTSARVLHLKRTGSLDLPEAKGDSSTDDGWGEALQYRADPDGHGFWIRSLGSDEAAGAPPEAGPGDTRRDIVMKNGLLEEDGGCTKGLLRADAAARLRGTMQSIDQLDRACRVYAVDHHHYPISIGWMDAAKLAPEIGLERIWFMLGDGWTHPLEYTSAEGRSYTIRSLGKDGVEDSALELGPTDDLKADIVYSNGAFRSWPRRFPPERSLKRNIFLPFQRYSD